MALSHGQSGDETLMVNLNGIFAALWRSWWILLSVAGMAALLTWHVMRQTPPTYVGTITLQVGDVMRSIRPGDGEFGITQSLANGYAEMALRQPVLEGVVRTLNLPWNWQDLRKRIVVIHPIGALTIEIRAMDQDPVRARDIAATLADQLIATSPTSTRRQELDSRRQFIRSELDSLQTRIDQAKRDIERKQAEISQETTARGILDRQDEIRALELNLTNWQKSYNDQLPLLTGRGDPNSLTVIEPAVIPALPSGPFPVWFILLAFVGGGMVAATGVIGVELLNNTIRSRHDLRNALGDGPGGLVAYIPRHEVNAGPIAVLTEPDSLAANSYRLLAAQLRYGVLDHGPQVLMVTSPTNGEGKSTTAANLAAALALGGTDVLLVDLDLRKPSLHKVFGIPNRGGASALLRENDSNVEEYAVRTALPRLQLLPAGLPIGNPTELLSRSASTLLDGAACLADVVIVDGPPLLAVADSAVLTGCISDTLFVTRYQRTSIRDLRSSIDMLAGLPTRVCAVVMNAVPSEASTLYGYHLAADSSRGDGRSSPFGSVSKSALPGKATPISSTAVTREVEF